jgi:hypothetical protein
MMMKWEQLRMRDIKCGDLFWECEGPHEQAQFEAMADAVVNGDTVTLQGREIATGLPQAFMMRLSAPQYGPRLYSKPQYRGGVER